MTQKSQDIEFNVLGCKVRHRPDENNSHMAKAVIDLVLTEVNQLKASRPTLRDTDVAVLVALKIATEKFQLEDEYRNNIFKLEEALETALQTTSAIAN